VAKQNNDLAFLAMWLHTAASDVGQVKMVRELLGRAFTASREMYGLPAEDEPIDGEREIPTIISEFIAEWDEHDLRQRLDEEQNHPGQKPS
jgi:hypothetical protein